jgi:hypothetical protein
MVIARVLTPRAILMGVVAATLVVALLPARMLGWTVDLGDLVRIPVAPLSHVGGHVASFLRPPPMAVSLSGESPEVVAALEQERDLYQRLFHAQRQRAEELTAQIRLLQGLSVAGKNIQGLLVPVGVSMRDTRDPDGPIEVRLPAEARSRIAVGDAVIWKGQLLIGQVSRVTPARAVITPLVHPSIGVLEVEIISADDGGQISPPRVLLEPDGKGSFVGEIDRRVSVEPGDTVRLADGHWPPLAQAMVVGTVKEVRTLDSAPLLNIVVVTPQVRMGQLHTVVVATQDEQGEQR